MSTHPSWAVALRDGRMVDPVDARDTIAELRTRHDARVSRRREQGRKDRGADGDLGDALRLADDLLACILAMQEAQLTLRVRWREAEARNRYYEAMRLRWCDLQEAQREHYRAATGIEVPDDGDPDAR